MLAEDWWLRGGGVPASARSASSSPKLIELSVDSAVGVRSGWLRGDGERFLLVLVAEDDNGEDVNPVG